MKNRNINIAEPSMGLEEWNALKEPIDSGWITQGPKVKLFEQNFAKRHKVKHAIAVSNCTTALHIALVSLGIKAGDEVIVPAFTWVSTANVVLYCGAKPVFVDIDINTFNIDANKIKEKVTSKTKAIIPVHLFGLCSDIQKIKEIAPGIPIVEDAACAAGSSLYGEPAGSLGDIGCFSFHPRKSITTGEGGMITTNNDLLAKKINILRNHGASISEEQRHHGPKPYILPDFDTLGYNYRMTDLQGALGVIQLEKLDFFIHERDKWAQYYIKKLEGVKWLKTPTYPKGYNHGWQSFVTLVDKDKSPYERNVIMDMLQNKGISTRPGTHAVHMLGLYSKTFNIQKQDFYNSFIANDFSMSIPLHNKMTQEDYDYIIDTIKSI